MADEFIGKTIGGYEIQERIGQGGMATVYRALQTSMNRIVALKILPKQLMRDDTYLQRFEREVQIVAQLEHRNIIPVHDYGEYDGQPYIAMRYMPGGSVDDLLNKGPLTSETVLKIIAQVAPALDYAHTKNVLHRDLKPSNVLLDEAGGAYITDFGIARILGTENQGNTITTQGVVGTPAYMSPEQAQGHTLDGRSDLYSLGVMLFEMSTGRRPFESDTPYGIAVLQVTAQPPAARNINPKISGAVEQVIFKTLKKKAENRYQTAEELAEALRMAIENPGSFVHDTQPHPIPVREMMEQTQPTTPPPQSQPPQVIFAPPQHGLPSPPPQAPIYAPIGGTSGVGSQVLRPPTMSDPRRMKRVQRRKGGMWTGIIIGGVIGCALLTVSIVLAILAVNSFLDTDNATPESTLFPTLDPTSAAARQQILGVPGVDPNATTVYTNATPIPTRPPEEPTVAPVGQRATPTFDPALEGESTMIVYFDERSETDGTRNSDVYHLDLRTGAETRLTFDLAQDVYPVPSPDGQLIAFQSDRDGDFEIYVMDLNGGNLRQLTNNTYFDRLPSWSPDGAWVIFSSDTRDDGNYDLVRVPSSGGDPEMVFSNGDRNSHPRYSPDGRYVVFTSGDETDAATWEIARLEVETGEVIYLTDNDVRDASPVFSPDGSTVLYVTGDVGAAAIAIISAAGDGEPVTLYDDEGYEWGAYYSPDGAFILFNSQLSGQSLLYLMRADATDVRRIETETGGTGFTPQWVP